MIASVYEETAANGKLLLEYAENGGTVVSYSGTAQLASALGFVERRPVQIGYASLSGSHVPLRFISARPWAAQEGKDPVLTEFGSVFAGSPDGAPQGSALLSVKVGRGSVERWSVDIPGTIVHLQQGTGPVYDDGVQAADGTVQLREGILKADDRCAMDYEFDRQTTETGVNYFAYPYADMWRDEIVKHLIAIAVSKGKTLPFLSYWPSGVDSVAAISHDSDSNEDVHAETTLELLKELDIRTTWCMMEPGYSSSIYNEAKSRGHEIALHYNAVEFDGGIWDETRFKNQAAWLKRAAGVDRIATNKNHYTRFEGWDDLFRWCERYGVESDQSRGPSKNGNIGVLFGTCHPYFPISDFQEQNRFFNVLEIGFFNQDLNHPYLYDSSVIEPFLRIAKQAEGVAHFLFHQVHIHKIENVRTAVREVVEKVKEYGLAMWTVGEINDWERARRSLFIVDVDDRGVPVVQGASLPQPADLYVPVPKDRLTDGQAYELKFGVPCRKYSTARHADRATAVIAAKEA